MYACFSIVILLLLCMFSYAHTCSGCPTFISVFLPRVYSSPGCTHVSSVLSEYIPVSSVLMSGVYSRSEYIPVSSVLMSGVYSRSEYIPVSSVLLY